MKEQSPTNKKMVMRQLEQFNRAPRMEGRGRNKGTNPIRKQKQKRG